MNTITTSEEQADTQHYRIRKELLWLSISALIFYAGYTLLDYWSHLNWPPHEVTHLAELKALNCPTDGRYNFTKVQIPDMPRQTLNSGSMNRRVFFENPQCIAGLYLRFEGSGLRFTDYVYDVEKKRRTATIVTTFDKYEGE